MATKFKVGDRVTKTLDMNFDGKGHIIYPGDTGVVVRVHDADWIDIRVDRTGEIVPFNRSAAVELIPETTPIRGRLRSLLGLFRRWIKGRRKKTKF